MSKKKTNPQPQQNDIPVGKFERRTFTGDVEIRMDEAGNENEVFGYAAEFGVETELYQDNYEVIEEGAFDDVLEDDVRALFNHDSNLILARTNNSLKIGVDERGLHYKFDIPNTTCGNDLKENLRLKNVTQSSFGFIIKDATWMNEQRGGKNVWVRHVQKLKVLLDVSPVTYPAYLTTEVSLRSAEAAQQKMEAANDSKKPVPSNENWRRRSH